MSTALSLRTEKPLRKVEPANYETASAREPSLLSLLGWSDLPDALADAVSWELERYEEQIRDGFCFVDKDVLKKRDTICFWVNAYRDGMCNLTEAVSRIESI